MVSFLKRLVRFFLDKEFWITVPIELLGILLFCFTICYVLFFASIAGIYKLILVVFIGAGLYIMWFYNAQTFKETVVQHIYQSYYRNIILG